MIKISFFFSSHHSFWVAPLPNPKLQGLLCHKTDPWKIFIQVAWKQPHKEKINNSSPGIWKTKIQTNYRSCSKSHKNSAPVSCTVPAFAFPWPWWQGISCHLFPLNLKKYLGTLQKSSFPGGKKPITLPLTIFFRLKHPLEQENFPYWKGVKALQLLLAKI